MTGDRTTAAALGGVALLERAIGYTLGSLQLVAPDALARPTPCREWDLRALLGHLEDSLRALHEALANGVVHLRRAQPEPQPEPVFGGGEHTRSFPAVDQVANLRSLAAVLLGAGTNADGRRAISVAGRHLTAGIVTGTGAIEITLHGWDVAQACGHTRPIPPALAEDLLELSPLLVTDADRPARFAAAIAVSPLAGPGDRLLAFLGRHPDQL